MHGAAIPQHTDRLHAHTGALELEPTAHFDAHSHLHTAHQEYIPPAQLSSCITQLSALIAMAQQHHTGQSARFEMKEGDTSTHEAHMPHDSEWHRELRCVCAPVFAPRINADAYLSMGRWVVAPLCAGASRRCRWS
jgi:hypothetical protein